MIASIAPILPYAAGLLAFCLVVWARANHLAVRRSRRHFRAAERRYGELQEVLGGEPPLVARPIGQLAAECDSSHAFVDGVLDLEKHGQRDEATRALTDRALDGLFGPARFSVVVLQMVAPLLAVSFTAVEMSAALSEFAGSSDRNQLFLHLGCGLLASATAVTIAAVSSVHKVGLARLEGQAETSLSLLASRLVQASNAPERRTS